MKKILRRARSVARAGSSRLWFFAGSDGAGC